jgi:predicted RNase H-like HicB family nuclease
MVMTVAKLQAKPKRKVLLYPGEDGYFVVEVPSLPGCISQGKTREEALANISEAITLYIEVLQERGEPVPDDTVEVVDLNFHQRANA